MTRNLHIALSCIFFVLILTSPIFAALNPPSSPLLESAQMTRLKIPDFPLKDSFEMYMKYSAVIAPVGELYIKDKDQNTFERILTYAHLKSFIRPLNNSDEALAVARFFTKEPTRFLLDLNPIYGIETIDVIQNFPFDLTSFLKPIKVWEEQGAWIIERDIIFYPTWVKQHLEHAARLGRSHEVVSKSGEYTFEVKEILTEGDRLNELLPYYE